VDVDYAPRLRAERLITSGRVILAAVSLLAIWLHPTTPSHHVRTTYLLLAAYVVYAGILAGIAWRARAPLPALFGTLTQVVDLFLFSAFVYFTEGPASPFFVYFTFAIVAATLRWHWRGAVWTAAVALLAFNGIGLYAITAGVQADVELNRFIIRSVYVVVLTVLLAALGAHEQRRRGEMAHLGAWPATIPHDVPTAVWQMLASATQLVGSPRALLVWEDRDEPWLHLTAWESEGSRFRQWRESPGAFLPLVDPALGDAHFITGNAAAAAADVLRSATGGPLQWRGTPIHRTLTDGFTMRSVLALALRGECGRGRLFLLDHKRLTADDLVIGEVIARHVAESLDHLALSRQLRDSAASEERARLFRDLHDGVLQSLTGAALKLQTAQRLLDVDDAAARVELHDVQQLLSEEQRNLRLFIRDAKQERRTPPDAGSLPIRLQQLVQHVEDVWGLRTTLDLRGCNGATDRLASDVGYLVREALVNAARHGGASTVNVAVAVEQDTLLIDVADNGQGFPFSGELEHEVLTREQLGPVMLKQRVDALGGSLAIHSGTHGAQLHIRLPLAARER
jgi:signal transduction histidine kinase